MKIRRKNPAFYKIGYHATNKIDEIIDSGKLKADKRDFSIYKGKIPIYFMTYDRLNFLTTSLKRYLHTFKYIIKVNVSNFNQYPDFGTLQDFGFQRENLADWSDQNYIISYSETMQKPPPAHMKKWMIKFNNQIPIKEFFTNPILIKDAIATTHTFTIIEDIPINKIIDINEFSPKFK